MMCTHSRCVFNDVHFYNCAPFNGGLLTPRNSTGALRCATAAQARGSSSAPAVQAKVCTGGG